MKLNIKKLVLKNFKAFVGHQFEIGSYNLAILDGPNGFGKTSFFDAVEFLLTGDIGRYNNLENSVVDKRSIALGSPIVHDQAVAGAEISIVAEIETSHGLFYLKRSASKDKLDKGKGLGLKLFKLYELTSIDGEGRLVQDEESFLGTILGVGYLRDFKLFHYIEQEDNTAILKSKASTKQQKIDHLFDVGDYREKIKKIDSAKELIASLKTTAKREDLNSRKTEIEQLHRSVNVGDENVIEPYQRLISATHQPWDHEDIVVKSSIIATWLGDEGALNRLRKFIEGVDNFINSKYNSKIDKVLKPKQEALESLLRFGGRLDSIAVYKNDVALYDFGVDFLSKFESGIPSSLKEDLKFDSDVFDSFGFELNYNDFSQAVAEIKLIVENSSAVELAYNELKAARDLFVSKYSSEHISHDDANCPACGYDWKSYDELLRHMESQRLVLETLVDVNGEALKRNIELFERKVLGPIRKAIGEHAAVQKDSIDYKKKITELREEQVSYLRKLVRAYLSYGIDVRPFYCISFDLQESLGVNRLGEAVSALYRVVDHDAIDEDFQEIFEQVFLEDDNAALSLELDSIDRKISYVKAAYTRSIYGDIKDKEKSYSAAEDIYKKAIYLDKALSKLRDIYNENLNSYVASIAKGIEVLFHIYSGRLLQNFQSGLGIFIETDGKNLSFRENPKKLHDVIFSMSSGQLSSLVLSFTLALNKRYARNAILLIDDPVQTLDDINVAGFVDLLRTEFSDRQIILSTHEDEMSAYMQYKFKKYNLDAEGLDFKQVFAVN
ncbi:AAA family ATPase [Pseudomonas sp. DR48]|uniref:ATP-binding protein n=1 Tax=Pseudomonas sp. DR48 TaxID=2871095 RepID=UPI001C997615|nr:AAA family ATPase [Pseudomonas sp. DR48]QZP34758.1 AAA family ATPase [Pseudomonas sp. DR48]